MAKPRLAAKSKGCAAPCRSGHANERLIACFPKQPTLLAVADLASQARFASIDDRTDLLAKLQAALPIALSITEINSRLLRERFELNWLDQLLDK